MFISLNSMLRRQRRRIAVLAALIGLAGVVVVAHSAMADHMDDGAAMCLAVVEAVAGAGIGIAAVLLVLRRRPVLTLAPTALAEPVAVPAPVPRRARAGPRHTQVFRL